MVSPLQDLTRFDQFESKQYIGEGAFGVVFSVRKKVLDETLIMQ